MLDNSDGTLPVDFDEVAITRRMYRNGESEYLINGTVARRMDVLDILHDSGLGTGTAFHHLPGLARLHPAERSRRIAARSSRRPPACSSTSSARRKASGSWRTWTSTSCAPATWWGRWPGSWGRSSARPRSARTYQELAGAAGGAERYRWRWTICAGCRRSGTRPRRARRRLPPSWRSAGAPSQAAEEAVEELQERIRQRDAGRWRPVAAPPARQRRPSSASTRRP